MDYVSPEDAAGRAGESDTHCEPFDTIAKRGWGRYTSEKIVLSNENPGAAIAPGGPCLGITMPFAKFAWSHPSAPKSLLERMESINPFKVHIT